MLKKILTGLLIVLVGFLLFASTRPDSFRVERKIVINAPPERIQRELENFTRWRAWSPYEKKDPGMQRTFSGPESGVGARYSWSGNEQVGSGSMQVLASSPSEVRLQLDFIKPFEAHNIAIFSLQRINKGSNTGSTSAETEVTWAMEGPVPYFAKIVHLVFDMDTMIGGDFALGLADLKIVTESQP